MLHLLVAVNKRLKNNGKNSNCTENTVSPQTVFVGGVISSNSFNKRWRNE